MRPLRCLAPFLQFKKGEKLPMEECHCSWIPSFHSQHSTYSSVIYLWWSFLTADLQEMFQ